MLPSVVNGTGAQGARPTWAGSATPCEDLWYPDGTPQQPGFGVVSQPGWDGWRWEGQLDEFF